MKLMHKWLTALSIPVHRVSDELHEKFPWLPHRKQATHLVIGLALSYVGAYLAHAAHDCTFPVLADAGAYTLHGFGAAPIIKLVADTLKYEI